MQERLGVRERLEPWAKKVIRPYMPDQHRDFFAALPFVVIGARDAQDRPWATLLTGSPGFVRSPDATSLNIDAWPSHGDALAGSLEQDSDIGLLGIEPHTARRNRMNGRIVEAHAEGFTLGVSQSFGNCAQYIRARNWRWAPTRLLHRPS